MPKVFLLMSTASSCRQPPRVDSLLVSTASSCRQPPRGDPWKLSSQLKQISIPRECSQGGKRIDPPPRKRKFSDANTSETVPSVLQLNIEGPSASKICVIVQLANGLQYIY